MSKIFHLTLLSAISLGTFQSAIASNTVDELLENAQKLAAQKQQRHRDLEEEKTLYTKMKNDYDALNPKKEVKVPLKRANSIEELDEYKACNELLKAQLDTRSLEVLGEEEKKFDQIKSALAILEPKIPVNKPVLGTSSLENVTKMREQNQKLGQVLNFAIQKEEAKKKAASASSSESIKESSINPAASASPVPAFSEGKVQPSPTYSVVEPIPQPAPAPLPMPAPTEIIFAPPTIYTIPNNVMYPTPYSYYPGTMFLTPSSYAQPQPAPVFQEITPLPARVVTAPPAPAPAVHEFTMWKGCKLWTKDGDVDYEHKRMVPNPDPKKRHENFSVAGLKDLRRIPTELDVRNMKTSQILYQYAGHKDSHHARQLAKDYEKRGD